MAGALAAADVDSPAEIPVFIHRATRARPRICLARPPTVSAGQHPPPARMSVTVHRFHGMMTVMTE
jgi:hypothetical protein